MKINLDDTDIFVKDVFEAVKVAKCLKETGRCDLFRGQIESYPLVPGFFRSNTNQETEINRLNKFAGWIESIPELKSFHGNVDQITAVAQHYGMKTHFLDFTRNPEIAGFFASDGDKREDIKYSTIVCANQEVFTKSWAGIKYKDSGILTRIVDIDIRNLWRLHSQDGVFIDVRIPPDTLEAFSFFRHIYFPYTVQYDLVSDDKIYPLEKSHLEILIDEYFYLEFWENEMKEQTKNYDVVIDFSQSKEVFGRANAFVSNALPNHHPSWNIEHIEEWLKEPNEQYQHIFSGISITIVINRNLSIRELANYIKGVIHDILSTNSEYRAKKLGWNIIDQDGKLVTVDKRQLEILDDDTYPQIECGQYVSILWEGLRRLPYSDDQIAKCIANYIVFGIFDEIGISDLLGEHTGVEFTTGTSINSGYVSDESFLTCLRPDFMDLLIDEERVKITNSEIKLYNILMILSDPRSLFEFTSFVDLFVQQIIPIQALYKRENDVIIFSPVRLEIFGLL